MKRKILTTIAFIAFVTLFVFAKDNPKAATYKTHETKDTSAPVVYFIKDINTRKLFKSVQSHGLGCKRKSRC